MMRLSRRNTWVIFVLCVVLVLDGLGWVSWQMVRLEKRERQARAKAAMQEKVQLALWRMDGFLGPFIAAQAAQPYFAYRAFYPADRAYTRMWEPVDTGEVLVPSPLLEAHNPFVKLYFQASADGWLGSPQVPPAELRDRLEGVSLSHVLQAERRLVELTALLRGRPMPMSADNAISDHHTTQLDTASPLDDQSFNTLGTTPLPKAADAADTLLEKSSKVMADLTRHNKTQAGAEPAEEDASEPELAARRRAAARASTPMALASPLSKADAPARNAEASSALKPSDTSKEPEALPSSSVQVEVGPFMPIWVGDAASHIHELLYIRRVKVGSDQTVQGFWVDWPALRRALRARITDLLPRATLVPIENDAIDPSDALIEPTESMLAGAPVALEPGPIEVGQDGPLLAWRVLGVAWFAVLAAIVAIGLVLEASIRLSERQGRFVAAVTHELRTPLTTFCLYSQMLDDGLISDEAKKKQYVRVLKNESERLAAIVENVLAYARRSGTVSAVGSEADQVKQAQADRVEAAVVWEKLCDLARQRCQRAGVALEVQTDVDAAAQMVMGDGDSIERILSNLIDNAIKYGCCDEAPTVSLRLRQGRAGVVELVVEDRGKGVPKADRERIFKPFVRGNARAQQASPGLGLGLWLSRQVARSLGGELRLETPDSSSRGAVFVVELNTCEPAGANQD